MFGMKSCSNEEQMINKRYQEYQLYWYQKCIQLTPIYMAFDFLFCLVFDHVLPHSDVFLEGFYRR